jgi:hypothetical protein
LRPQAVGDQGFLQPGRFSRTGLHRTNVGADTFGQGITDVLSLVRVATGAFFDDPLNGRDGEGHASRLDALQVDRRQQLITLAAAFPGLAEGEILELAQRFAARRRACFRPGLQQLRHGWRDRRHVKHFAILDQDRGRTDLRLQAPDQGRRLPVLR